MATRVDNPRHLVAALGGPAKVAWMLGEVSPAAVRQWAVRGYVPYRHLVALAGAIELARLHYSGPVTPGLEDAPR